MMPYNTRRNYFVALMILLSGGVWSGAMLAQSPATSASWAEKIHFKPVVGIQMWSIYTTGEELYDATAAEYQPVENRFDVMLRRSRLGFKIQPLEVLQISVIGSMDVVGRDLLSPTQGASNNGAAPSFGLWNAIAQWRVIPKKEVLYLATGYLTPQFSREHITGALRVSSLEKSWSQNYIRRHLMGTGPGRAAGVQLGGLLRKQESPFALTYDAGLFNPLYEAYNGNSTGKQSSVLVTGKLTFHLGDPESDTYSLSHKVNTFGKRHGISLGLSHAVQGKTDLFDRNQASAFDVLFNWGPVNVDGEWAWLSRRGPGAGGSAGERIAAFQTGFFRISYNLTMQENKVLEPVVMLMDFKGAMDLQGQTDALALKSFAGKDQALDLGVNYYPVPEIRLSLHYTIQNGEDGDASPGATFNNYLFQRDVGAIHRGDYLGLGVVFSY